VSATRLIQTAIYGVLSVDSTLASLSLTEEIDNPGVFTTVGVYNDVPEDATYPHVLISKATETPWHTMGGSAVGLGYKDIIRIHTYSRYDGDLEALQIHDRIVALLNFQPMTIAGFGSTMTEYEQGRMFVEDIKKIETRHWVDEFCVRAH
jgi:hypothetical protein